MIGLKDEFVREVEALLPGDEWRELIAALDGEAVTGVRMNTRKRVDVEWSRYGAEAVRWCKEGVVLKERPLFAGMPAWHGGAFYVQEPASMVTSEVVRRLCERLETDAPVYLDSCAAPGGKTTAAISALPPGSFVVANEFVSVRANILAENVAKWGSPNVAVTQGNTAAFSKMVAAFDIVAVDAPCSGEGMMRKDEDARRQWSEGLVKQCAELQREIIDNVWPALKPGGYLIYSTCTFNRTEDEEMLAYIRDEHGGEAVDLGLNQEYGIPRSLDAALPGLRFMPHRTQGEGLFMGIMRKPEGAEVSTGRQGRKAKGKRSKEVVKMPAEVSGWLCNSETYVICEDKEGLIRAIPAPYAELVETLERVTRVVSAGVSIGEIKGKNVVPAGGLALSTALNQEAFASVELSEMEALNYLRREAITLLPDAPRGLVLVKHGGLPLGFVKNLGNRANNLYPQHWRLRH